MKVVLAPLIPAFMGIGFLAYCHNQMLITYGCLVNLAVCVMLLYWKPQRTIMHCSFIMAISLMIMFLHATNPFTKIMENVTVLMLILVPLLDSGTCFVKRLAKRKPLFKADSDNYHVALRNNGYNETWQFIILLTHSFIYAAVGVVCDLGGVDTDLVLIVIALAFVCHVSMISTLKKK